MKRLINIINESAIESKISDIKTYVMNSNNFKDESEIDLQDIKFRYDIDGYRHVWKVSWNGYPIKSISYSDGMISVKDIDELAKNKMILKLNEEDPLALKYFCEKNISKFKKSIKENYLDSDFIFKNLWDILVWTNAKVEGKTKIEVLPVVSFQLTIKHKSDKYAHDELITFDLNGNVINKSDNDEYYIYMENVYPDLKKDFTDFINKTNKKYKLN